MFSSFLEGFRRIAPNSNDPNRVIEVPIDDYLCSVIVCRDECLVLYRTEEKQDSTKFDIILLIDVTQASNKAFR